MGTGLRSAYDAEMATPVWNAATAPSRRSAKAGIAAAPSEAMSLNLPENSSSEQQREVLDALPVLVFLEKAGKVVFANAEARHTLGVSEGEWVERSVGDIQLIFPISGRCDHPAGADGKDICCAALCCVGCRLRHVHRTACQKLSARLNNS